EFMERVLLPSRELSLRQSWGDSEEALTEQEWISCDNVNELASLEYPNKNTNRFVPLAIHWCERIWTLIWRYQFARSDTSRAHVEGRGSHPHDVCQRETSRLMARWAFDVLWANEAIEVLVWDEDPHKAAVYAGYAASLHRSEQTGVETRELNFEKKMAAEA